MESQSQKKDSIAKLVVSKSNPGSGVRSIQKVVEELIGVLARVVRSILASTKTSVGLQSEQLVITMIEQTLPWTKKKKKKGNSTMKISFIKN